MSKPLLVIGAGGHARSVISCAQQSGNSVEGVIDPNFKGAEESMLEVPVIGGLEILDARLPEDVDVHIAVGDNTERKILAAEMKGRGYTCRTLLHPTAIIDETASIGQGVLVCAGASIGPLCKIADGVILNTAALIDHEVTVGSYSHVAPGCCIAGRVSIGSLTFVGIGSVIIDQLTIGDSALIGANSTITRPVKDGERVVAVDRRL